MTRSWIQAQKGRRVDSSKLETDWSLDETDSETGDSVYHNSLLSVSRFGVVLVPFITLNQDEEFVEYYVDAHVSGHGRPAYLDPNRNEIRQVKDEIEELLL